MKKLLVISLLFATSHLAAAANTEEKALLNSINNVPEKVIQLAGKEMIDETLKFVRNEAEKRGMLLNSSVYDLYLEFEQKGLRKFIADHQDAVAKADEMLHKVVKESEAWFCVAEELNEENSSQETRLSAWSREFFHFSKELIDLAKEEGNFPADFVMSASPKERILLNNGKFLSADQIFILRAATLVILGGFTNRYTFMLEADFDYFVSEEFKAQFRKILADLMVQQS
ncbi:hypothetical protein K2X40_04370 [Candidatus Babeliales bacterium]|nr:hypothetical protein [Candidatus Babeliales bacterium]